MKTPVLVGNCTGFAVNRVFFPYTQASAGAGSSHAFSVWVTPSRRRGGSRRARGGPPWLCPRVQTSVPACSSFAGLLTLTGHEPQAQPGQLSLLPLLPVCCNSYCRQPACWWTWAWTRTASMPPLPASACPWARSGVLHAAAGQQARRQGRRRAMLVVACRACSPLACEPHSQYASANSSLSMAMATHFSEHGPRPHPPTHPPTHPTNTMQAERPGGRRRGAARGQEHPGVLPGALLPRPHHPAAGGEQAPGGEDGCASPACCAPRSCLPSAATPACSLLDTPPMHALARAPTPSTTHPPTPTHPYTHHPPRRPQALASTSMMPAAAPRPTLSWPRWWSSRARWAGRPEAGPQEGAVQGPASANRQPVVAPALLVLQMSQALAGAVVNPRRARA